MSILPKKTLASISKIEDSIILKKNRKAIAIALESLPPKEERVQSIKKKFLMGEEKPRLKDYCGVLTFNEYNSIPD